MFKSTYLIGRLSLKCGTIPVKADKYEINLLITLIHSLCSISSVCNGAKVMVFNVTFNNISAMPWRSVLLVKVTGEPRKTTDLPQSH